MGLGFLLFKQSDHCPSVVQLLGESYNPHIQYCAEEALGLKEPMNKDPTNYVRQGVLIVSAVILVQQTDQTCPKGNGQERGKFCVKEH